MASTHMQVVGSFPKKRLAVLQLCLCVLSLCSRVFFVPKEGGKNIAWVAGRFSNEERK